MKLIRESARATKALHKNTTELYTGNLLPRDIRRIEDGSGDAVSVRWVREASERWSSSFELTLTRSDLVKLAAKLG